MSGNCRWYFTSQTLKCDLCTGRDDLSVSSWCALEMRVHGAFCLLCLKWRDSVLQTCRRGVIRGDFLTQRNVTLNDDSEKNPHCIFALWQMTIHHCTSYTNCVYDCEVKLSRRYMENKQNIFTFASHCDLLLVTAKEQLLKTHFSISEMQEQAINEANQCMPT